MDRLLAETLVTISHPDDRLAAEAWWSADEPETVTVYFVAFGGGLPRSQPPAPEASGPARREVTLTPAQARWCVQAADELLARARACVHATAGAGLDESPGELEAMAYYKFTARARAGKVILSDSLSAPERAGAAAVSGRDWQDWARERVLAAAGRAGRPRKARRKA